MEVILETIFIVLLHCSKETESYLLQSMLNNSNNN